MIKRCFTGLTEHKVSTLYKSIIRPGLEYYGAPLWSHWLKKGVQFLEKVQERCRKLCNTDIIQESLEESTMSDLSETYKYAWTVQDSL